MTEYGDPELADAFGAHPTHPLGLIIYGILNFIFMLIYSFVHSIHTVSIALPDIVKVHQQSGRRQLAQCTAMMCAVTHRQ